MKYNEWLFTRQNSIGSSDVAAIVTGRFGGIWNVVGQRLGVIGPTESTLRMEIGLLLEPPMVELFNRATGMDALIAEPYTRVIHPDHPHHSATPDAWVGVDGKAVPLELKTVEGYAAQGWDENETDGGDGAHPYAWAQLQWQLWVTGAPFGFVAALIGLSDFRWYPTRRDDEFIAHLVTQAEHAWDLIQRGELPEPDASDACTQALGGKFNDLGTEVELDADADEAAAQYLKLRDEAKAASEKQKAAANRLRLAMGDAAVATTTGHRVTWKKNKSGRRALTVRASFGSDAELT